MGVVRCGMHGCKCCWGCGLCPSCEGHAFRLGRGDYCPDCVKRLKVQGYVWSEFYQNYVKPEVAAKVNGQAILKF